MLLNEGECDLSRILLLGNSSIKKRMKIEEIKKNNQDAEFIRLFPENYSSENFSNIFTMGDLFSKKKIIIISEFDKYNISQQEKIARLINQVGEAFKGFIILESQNETKILKSIKFEIKVDANQPPPWKEDLWINYLKEIANKFSKNLNDEAAEKLIQIVGKNEELIYEEIKKLSIYSKSNDILSQEIQEISSVFSTVNLEELCYELARKNQKKVQDEFQKAVSSSNFTSIGMLGYMNRYFLDLYSVILYGENKKYYTWPEIAKISKESQVSQQRVASFLGYNFKSDKTKKTNLENMYSTISLGKIIIEVEKLDRSLKAGGDAKVLLASFFHDFCTDKL